MTDLTRITCEEAFRRLDDYLDRELSPEETQLVQDHLQVCALCAREFNYEESLLRALRNKLKTSPAPAELVDRVRQLFGPNGNDPSGQGSVPRAD